MLLRLAMPTRNALAQVFQQQIDAGGQGEIRVYAGAIPRSADDAAERDNLLGVLTFASPSAGQSEDGELEFGAIAEEPAARRTGSATWARIVDGAGETVFDVDVSDRSGDGVVRLNTVDIVVGGPIRLTRFVLGMPEG